MKLIIGSGHGWETSGKRSIFHKIGNKAKLRENNFNEAVANKLSIIVNNSVFITPEWWDVPLSERCKREHEHYVKDQSIFLSIHADAFTKKDVAHGGTFFYNSYKGKLIAEHFTKYFRNQNYPIGIRSPKQANFYMLKNTKSPAILFEAGFMTSEKDLKYLLDDKFRNDVARLLKEAFISV
jgi:N-acetylmuramoyl-L-alanine amidase